MGFGTGLGMFIIYRAGGNEAQSSMGIGGLMHGLRHGLLHRLLDGRNFCMGIGGRCRLGWEGDGGHVGSLSRYMEGLGRRSSGGVEALVGEGRLHEAARAVVGLERVRVWAVASPEVSGAICGAICGGCAVVVVVGSRVEFRGNLEWLFVMEDGSD
ncbi:hypothetical protein LIER_43226 [Lithospermum erythrorhizon]|uniref:Uncharacterized protein n=1 Tax=Lithospermum erythrorhizon TaxID=34254 RepID=A0AAV3PNT4_LITER